MATRIVVKKFRPPFKVHGGKYYLCDWIIGHFPANYEDLIYLESHGGAASTLLNKAPSKKEILNDINPKSVNIFHCLRSNPDEFISAIKSIEYNEKNFKEASKKAFEFGNIESAVNELVSRRMSRGGLKSHFSWSKRLRNGRSGDLNAWETFKDLLLPISNRLKDVEITCMDAVQLIEKVVDEKNILIYADPPYLHSTRTSKKAYEYEMNDEDHKKLAVVLNKCKGKVILSGYESDLYKDIYKGWRCSKKEVKNNAGQRKVKSTRIECLWLNY